MMHPVPAQAVLIHAPHLQSPNDPASLKKRIYARTILGLSIAQIIFGAVCGVMAIVALTHGIVTVSDVQWADTHANGIWSGAFYILTGVFGIVAAKTKYYAWIVTTMIFCILSAVMTISNFSYGSIGIIQAVVFENDDYYWRNPDDYSDNGNGYGEVIADSMPYFNYDDEKNVSLSVGSILIIMGLAEAVIAIICACFSCHAVCCCGRKTSMVYAVPMMYNENVLQLLGNMPANVTMPANGSGNALPTYISVLPSNEPGVQQAQAAVPSAGALAGAPPAYSMEAELLTKMPV